MTEIFLEKLKSFNIDLMDPTVPPLARLCFIFFLLTLVSLFSFYNFVVYILVMRLTETEWFLNFIKGKKRLTKMVNFYRTVNTGFVVYDLLLFGFVNCGMLYLSFLVFYPYYKIF